MARPVRVFCPPVLVPFEWSGPVYMGPRLRGDDMGVGRDDNTANLAPMRGRGDERQNSDTPQPPSPGFFALAVSAGAASSTRPVRSFSTIFFNSSGSGSRSRACDHWNVASSVRPVFQ